MLKHTSTNNKRQSNNNKNNNQIHSTTTKRSIHITTKCNNKSVFSTSIKRTPTKTSKMINYSKSSSKTKHINHISNHSFSTSPTTTTTQDIDKPKYIDITIKHDHLSERAIRTLDSSFEPAFRYGMTRYPCPRQLLSNEEFDNISNIVDVNNGRQIQLNDSLKTVFGDNKDIKLKWTNTMTFDFTSNTLIPKFTREINIVQPTYNMLCDIDELSDQLLIIRNSDVYDLSTPIKQLSNPTTTTPITTSKRIDIWDRNANEVFHPYFQSNNNNTTKNDDSNNKPPLADIKLKWEFKKSLSQEQKELITTLSPILSQNYKSHPGKYIRHLNIHNPSGQYTIGQIAINRPLIDLLPGWCYGNPNIMSKPGPNLYVSSPSALNGQWIQLQGKNQIDPDDLFPFRIGDFVRNDGETIKFTTRDPLITDILSSVKSFFSFN